MVDKLKNLKRDYEHIWQFSRIGGVNRVNLTSGKDLLYLDQLDQKLWTALSCPVHGLEIDSQTLTLIDENEDGRIRVPEVIAAVKWITSVIKNPDDLSLESDEMPLSAIDDSTDEGKILLASAKQILTNLGKEEFDTITVADTSDVKGIFANSVSNGDGIIIEESAKKAELKELIVHIINEEFPEGSTGYEINFKEPKKIPEISVDMVTNFMYVGDEMTFKVTTKNFEGEVFAATGDKKVAIVLPDKSGRTLKATGPGRTHLIVGNKDYNRRFEVNVESRPESEVKVNE